MRDDLELYWRMYQENTTHGRHHEVQRATLTTVVVAIAAATVGFIRPHDLPLGKGYLPLTLLLTLLGLFGAVVTRKHYERFALHGRRASKYRNKLDSSLPGIDLKKLKQEADDEHAKQFPRTSKLSLSWLWVGVHLSVAAIGAVLSILILSP